MNTQEIKKIICNILCLDSAPNKRKLRAYKDISEVVIQRLAFAIRDKFKINVDMFYECETVGDVIDFVFKQSKIAKKENDRQLSMVPGTKVTMTGGAELEKYTGKVWEVTHGPQWIHGRWIVWLKGHYNGYSCSYFDIVH